MADKSRADKSRSAGKRLRSEEIHWRCEPLVFEQHRQNGGDERPHIIGQARAVNALELGLALEAPGYNVFVCGPSGTGKMSTVRALLRERPDRGRSLWDFLYVHNFADPDRPRLIRMGAGAGRRFRRHFEELVDGLPDRIQRVLDRDTVVRKRDRLVAAFEGLEREQIDGLETLCKAQRFQLAQVQVGDVQHLDIYPVYRKKPIDIDELNDLAASGKARVPNLDKTNDRYGMLKNELREMLSRLRKAARHMHEEVDELECGAVRADLDEMFADLREQYPYDGVGAWLDQVAAAITEHLDLFHSEDRGEEEAEQQGLELLERVESLLMRLRINVVLDNDGQSGTPVVFENFPTFTNLLGTVERRGDEPQGAVDFTHIKAGSLLRADGGFLVLNANDAVTEAGAWRALLRVLKTREQEIQSPEQFLSPGGATALKPEPIRLDVKVIAVGDDELYRMLYLGSDDFRRVFKIKADFDDVMPRNAENIALYARHARQVTTEESLVPVGDDALARVVELGVRLAGRRDELSTRFSDLTDVLREASYRARVAGGERIGASHVDATLKARRGRHGLIEEKFHQLIERETVDIPTSGREIGAVNALTVLDLADHTFGQPCRVTATCTAGREGIISIEREVRLSGRIHDKGTLLISAWLRTTYLPDKPLSLCATVAFDQLHDEVDGDSASVAEAVALLSALTGVGVHCGRAVTGAIDQRGQVLPVGGVNEKVEGFFQICKARGLTGDQGVVVPDANRANLMLNGEVVAAVEAGRFAIWAVRTVDAVIELLTGRAAGRRSKRGTFGSATFNRRVRERLLELCEQAGPRPEVTPTLAG